MFVHPSDLLQIEAFPPGSLDMPEGGICAVVYRPNGYFALRWVGSQAAPWKMIADLIVELLRSPNVEMDLWGSIAAVVSEELGKPDCIEQTATNLYR